MEGENLSRIYQRIVSTLLTGRHSKLEREKAKVMIARTLDRYELSTCDHIDSYRQGLSKSELTERLTKGALEQIIAYGAGAVPEALANRRVDKADQVEKSLVATYYPEIYAEYLKRQERKKSMMFRRSEPPKGRDVRLPSS